jgi:hypothetical protein
MDKKGVEVLAQQQIEFKYPEAVEKYWRLY